ncbi:exocyst complex component 3-like protein 2 [Marmota marmota marmota]|uniref:exocyst complex component 3-like protein 2 n=1 Tax=Marmota marmota marmota TaxID=9994 RepID=UPI002092AB3E|nr:exocyst complex component 3-like protein 2 [Marmota marmota marmota]
MPILKSLGVADPKVPRAGTLPLRSSRNPFEDIPGLEEESGELGTLPNGTSCHRRATLEKLAGLSPFRLGWAQGRRAGSPGDGPPRSFLGRVLPPGLRRSSADFGLLARLQGTRAHGDEEGPGEAARRLAFLRLGRGPKPRRASLAERVVPAGEAAPEPPPKVPEPPKMKEPLSVLEILSLIQQRELARADEHILELEAEELASSGRGGVRMGRGAREGSGSQTERLSARPGALTRHWAPSIMPTAPSSPPSFQQRVERFHEHPGIRELPSDTYISRTISLVNCGPPLRALAERLARVGPPESEPAREASASSLDRVTRLCHRVLADMLFQELQPYFNKLMRRKWLSSPEALDGIVGTLGAQALALRRMQDEPYQALVAELHRRALVEYVRPLLRGRLHCRSARTRSRMAGRLREDAAQLQRLFRRLESQASWLDAVVPHLAEVLQLEDTPSIQVEVGVLVRDYPDIRRKHVAALLDVRGLHNTATRQEILAVARDLELCEGGALSPPRDRAFFSDIPVPRPSFCLSLPLSVGRLPLSRLARPSLACLPLRPRPLSPSRPRAQR